MFLHWWISDLAERCGGGDTNACAGGGGRGMRRVTKPKDLSAALESARKESAAAFGDDTVFLEKLIQNPRHLEVQVFGDGAGAALHFHERDCSVQRNHQKVIEEAPAPNLPDAVRNLLFAHALSLTSAINYAGAGTVEFVMGAQDITPYFLEMNTRLQVEHPVTEEICGVDLVEWQLRQAAGLPLPLTQDQIRPKGHAVEIRLNAERPEAGFMPDTGRIAALAVPAHIRFETGVELGDTVSSHYDSMLAKLIAYGPDRDTALRELIDGIDGTVIAGPGNHLAFLRDCLTAPSFAQGQASTAFLDENFPDGWQPDPDALLRLRSHAALAAINGPDDPHLRTDGFRVGGRAAPGRVPLMVKDNYGSTELCLHLGEKPHVTQGERDIALGSAPHHIASADTAIQAVSHGLSVTLIAQSLASARRVERAGSIEQGVIIAPLTGLVTEVRAQSGAQVGKGETLIMMEAMKLVHSLNAPFDGTVSKLVVTQGETVTAKSVLMEIEKDT
jgi:3-methylcrotonyl-CoA carboxylase alpha subunit